MSHSTRVKSCGIHNDSFYVVRTMWMKSCGGDNESFHAGKVMRNKQ